MYCKSGADESDRLLTHDQTATRFTKSLKHVRVSGLFAAPKSRAINQSYTLCLAMASCPSWHDGRKFNGEFALMAEAIDVQVLMQEIRDRVRQGWDFAFVCPADDGNGVLEESEPGLASPEGARWKAASRAAHLPWARWRADS
jgi:hypothetical protein